MVNKLIISNCVEVLSESFLNQKPADLILSYFFKKNKNLGSHDRSHIAELFYGVIRNKRYLNKIAGDDVPHKLILIYLIKVLGKSIREIRSILSESEELWLKEIKSKKIVIEDWATKLSVPDWLWVRLLNQLGEDNAIKLAKSLLIPATFNLRVNTLKDKSVAAILDELRESFPQLAKSILETKISPIGISLPRGTAIHRHPLFLNGNIEVQDEGSQILSFLLAPGRGQMVADFCAGAGGKTLAISALMKNTGRIYAFDISDRRLANLKQRLKRSGGSNIMMQRIANENDLKIKRLKGKFDRVLIDAPCTGLGTLRRNPDLKWRQTEISLFELVSKQKAILNSAAQLCKIGGYLVYATCSLLNEENEEQINQFLINYPNFKLILPNTILSKYGITVGHDQYLKLNPYQNNTDGFFGALFKRVE